MEPLRISVRELVEFLLRTGSLDSRFSGIDRALEGARIHRRLQREAGEGYQAEVPLKQLYEKGSIVFSVEGRADGIFAEIDGTIVVDEIKTTTLPVEEITEDHNPVHWAQGKVYAAIYAMQNSLPSVAVRLTYFQVDEEVLLRYQKQFSASELDGFVQQLLSDYLPWAKRRLDWVTSRTASLSALKFPFDSYRPGQHAMAAEVYHACRDGNQLLCQAATGIGKTISVLFPALKSMAEGNGERIFYLTARTTTRKAAQDTLFLLHQSRPGLCLRFITLTAKEKLCPMDNVECTPEACPYANGYYDRIRDALWQGLDTLQLTPERLLALAEQYQVCPYELGLDLSLWCDVIIGDYNYLFDPAVSLQRFFDSKGDYLFLVDEAHNLPSRAREMYSARLSKSQFYHAKKLLGKGKGKLRSALTKINSTFLEWRHDCEDQPGRAIFSSQPPEPFWRSLAGLSPLLQEWLEENRSSDIHGELLNLYFEVRGFLRTLEHYDDHYITQFSAAGDEVRIQLLCLDPGDFLSDCFGKGRAAVLFSATVTPPGYYKDLCGIREAKAISIPSPFPRKNLGLFCAAGISTRYPDREASLVPICRMLHAMAASRPGNYQAFFPSYAYLQQVQTQYEMLYPDDHILVQSSRMDEAARADFLAAFDQPHSDGLLAFCVLGGVFGESIDLSGERLVGAAIVSVGLPQVNPVQEKLREYYEDCRGCGFDYAYRFPGMNKVLQAAGRVIRTPTDQGVVVFIDDRFSSLAYRRLFPGHLAPFRFVGSEEELTGQLRSFWGFPPEMQ